MKKMLIVLIFIVMLTVGAVLFLKKDTSSTVVQSNPSTVVESISPIISPTDSSKKTYTLSDVSQHKSNNDCWLIISNKVYDVTAFIPQHPGGNDILRGCGRDATSLFEREREHKENNATFYLLEYYIGELKS